VTHNNLLAAANWQCW